MKTVELSEDEIRSLTTCLYRAIYGYPHKSKPQYGTPQAFGGTLLLALLKKIEGLKEN